VTAHDPIRPSVGTIRVVQIGGERRSGGGANNDLWTVPACKDVEFGFGEMAGCSRISGFACRAYDAGRDGVR
jgi:hypothetical protein